MDVDKMLQELDNLSKQRQQFITKEDITDNEVRQLGDVAYKRHQLIARLSGMMLAGEFLYCPDCYSTSLEEVTCGLHKCKNCGEEFVKKVDDKGVYMVKQ